MESVNILLISSGIESSFDLNSCFNVDYVNIKWDLATIEHATVELTSPTTTV